MSRFWVYIDAKIQGPVDIPSLRKVPGFNLLTQVCIEGEQTWRMADEVIEIKSYFLAPPRLNSFALDTGNAAPKLEILMPTPEEMVLPEAIPQKIKMDAQKLPGGLVLPKGESPVPAGSASLRAVCPACEYKNPRDVEVCMKCGENLKAATPAQKEAAPGAIEFKPMANLPKPDSSPEPVAAPIPAPVIAKAPLVDTKSSAMVEIPMMKMVVGVAVAALVSGGSFMGFRAYKKKHLHKAPKTTSSDVRTLPPKTTSEAGHRTTAPKKSAKHYDHPQSKVRSVPKENSSPEETSPAQERSEGASFRVIPVATPLQKRQSAPVNSPYAVKRRANEDLWSTQEGHAIQQVQRYRIYGGLRTVERNAEILMQILRDREYNTAFESGKRIFLYNDMDWSAVDLQGPVYEVRLTFSGGKENDGSPKKPLRFAFAADLERGTVEPGGQDQIRSNTLHAFFDESRIAPEDRRSIAKDTEELVQAAQPGASPLALDTVVRQFAKVYSTDALSRVTAAYGFSEIKKKLDHDPRLGSEDVTESARPVPAAGTEKAALPGLTGMTTAAGKKEQASTSKAAPFSFPSKGRTVDFRMENGSGREKTFLLRATSTASPNRIWELLTGYDRLKQFMPDMLTSEREGQDGAAVIVHTVCLTRFMFFVFKMNLHFRVIEHAAQHTLEFERIAGDYESLRGSVEITTDPATKESQIAFRATLVPDGRTMGHKLEAMARRLLIPQLDTLRSKAEM